MSERDQSAPLDGEIVVEAESQALVPVAEQPPHVLPGFVLRDAVVFPGLVFPVAMDEAERRDALLHAKSNQGYCAVLTPRSAADVDAGAAGSGAGLAGVQHVGVLVRLIRILALPEQRASALVQVVRRLSVVELLRREPFWVVRVDYPVEQLPQGKQFEALVKQLRLRLQAFFEAHPNVSDELRIGGLSIESPPILADFVAQHLARDVAERVSFLTELDVERRVRRALEVTLRELDLLTVGNRISEEIRQKVEKHQRDYFLREQLRSIRTELGEERDPATAAVSELTRKLDEAKLPPEPRKRADEELRRLQLVPAESPEHNVVRSYLEWIASLPWSKVSQDRRDIAFARKVLDADHYGLTEVKDRIVEFLAVHQLNPEKTGSVLCFAGPPGVGKTSLGKSIARALGREFYRFSVGGMRDEAEIKGHRRTYIGAMPGRLLQGLRQVGTANPVFMLDELDKMGSDWRGDPSSALLEVLDPAQNSNFMDHYLDLPFDLSRVMFIATANIKTEIPGPLLDRLEIIDLPGYIPEEKLEIAARHLVPVQLREHGLGRGQLSFTRAALRRIIAEYTHEAGVRELNRQVGRVCRKRATEIVEGRAADAAGEVKLDAAQVAAYLGPAKVQADRLTHKVVPGVAVGMAWTPVGGEVLLIEAVRMPGKGQVKVTGHLGEVMAESASLAMAYVRSRAPDWGIDPGVFQSEDFHIHFPAGAVRKDGPSAGVTITTALVSLLTGRLVQPGMAMTGEITLRGEVLPVGGIREKVVAARRAGVRSVIVPERNRADVEEIPQGVRRRLRFVFAATYDDIHAVAFAKARGRGSVVSRRPSSGARGQRAARGVES